MLTWRTRNSPYLPLHKEARDSQHQSQLVMGANRQSDMEITKDRKSKSRKAADVLMAALLGRQAAGGTAWWAGPPHQGISISLVLPLCLPRYQLCWLSSLGQPLCYPSLAAFRRAAVVRSDSRMLSRLGFQGFSEQRKELYVYHLILLIFWLQEKSCSNHIHMGT